MTTVTRSLAPAARPEPTAKRRLPLLETYLREQQSLTAVERFAQRHEDATVPMAKRFYEDLLPTSKPAQGQQYAFQVDLDI